ncbi:hypothetical protein [Abyssisolibacter fermentans]|uniref:hypothetical protein n=1 Tax=Abyssisolibacter fermentans TaxID=1766203 RepID=UPI000830D89F|nr:hypothetical protein [Abyssisolibacter fermentans]
MNIFISSMNVLTKSILRKDDFVKKLIKKVSFISLEKCRPYCTCICRQIDIDYRDDYEESKIIEHPEY